MEPVEVCPWERLSTESAWAYESFRGFRDLGPTRTVRAAAGTPLDRRVPGHIERWAVRHDWRTRAMAWDVEVYRRRDEAVLDAIYRRPSPVEVVAPVDGHGDPWEQILAEVGGRSSFRA